MKNCSLQLEGTLVINSGIWLVVCTAYVASVIGIVAKFWVNGFRGRVLWIAWFGPLFVLILPLWMVSLIYLPQIDRDLSAVMFKLKKMSGNRVKFPFTVVISTLQYIPLFTLTLAAAIQENRGQQVSGRTRTVLAQTTLKVASYVTIQLGHVYASKLAG